MEYLGTEGVLGMRGRQLCGVWGRAEARTGRDQVAAANTEANAGRTVGERPHAS